MMTTAITEDASRVPTNPGPLLNDFERSPLRFEFEVLMEEYRTLHSEVQQRFIIENQVTSFALALIVGVLALSQILPGLMTFSEMIPFLRIACLVLTLLFSVFAVMKVEQDAMIASIGIYIVREIRPKVEEILKKVNKEDIEALHWESFRMQGQFSKSVYLTVVPFMAAMRYAITFLPGVLLLIVYWQLTRFKAPILPGEWLLFILAIAVQTLTVASALFTGTMYLSLRK